MGTWGLILVYLLFTTFSLWFTFLCFPRNGATYSLCIQSCFLSFKSLLMRPPLTSNDLFWLTANPVYFICFSFVITFPSRVSCLSSISHNDLCFKKLLPLPLEFIMISEYACFLFENNDYCLIIFVFPDVWHNAWHILDTQKGLLNKWVNEQLELIADKVGCLVDILSQNNQET